MVKSLSLSILVLVLTACGKFQAADYNGGTVDTAFLPYIKEYKADKLKYTGTDNVRAIDIVFWSLDSDTVGMCTRSGNHRLIQIDPDYWFNSSYGDQMVIFYHEMGHCDLGIWGHTDENSIMNPTGIYGWEFTTKRDYFLSLLFLEGK